VAGVIPANEFAPLLAHEAPEAIYVLGLGRALEAGFEVSIDSFSEAQKFHFENTLDLLSKPLGEPPGHVLVLAEGGDQHSSHGVVIGNGEDASATGAGEFFQRGFHLGSGIFQVLERDLDGLVVFFGIVAREQLGELGDIHPGYVEAVEFFLVALPGGIESACLSVLKTFVEEDGGDFIEALDPLRGKGRQGVGIPKFLRRGLHVRKGRKSLNLSLPADQGSGRALLEGLVVGSVGAERGVNILAKVLQQDIEGG
jgi:hypothetical protein